MEEGYERIRNENTGVNAEEALPYPDSLTVLYTTVEYDLRFRV